MGLSVEMCRLHAQVLSQELYHGCKLLRTRGKKEGIQAALLRHHWPAEVAPAAEASSYGCRHEGCHPRSAFSRSMGIETKVKEAVPSKLGSI